MSKVKFRMTTVEEITLDMGQLEPEFLRALMEDNFGYMGDDGVWSWNELGDLALVSYTVEVVG